MLLWELLESSHDAQVTAIDDWAGLRYPLVLAHQMAGKCLADRGAGADSRSDGLRVTKANGTDPP